MRALVTGADGFVGRHLVAALRGRGAEVLACGGPHASAGVLALDLADGDALRFALDHARPDVVFHLAAQSSVAASLHDPLPTYEVNALGTARLLAAVRAYRDAGAPPPRVVFASSAEIYGIRAPEELPLRETLEPRPVTPYGASKAAAEAIVLAEAAAFGFDALIARYFTNIGPGQDVRFAIASFAAQLARIADGEERVLFVGDLSVRRDLLDVRDAVEATIVLAERGTPGGIYNVCSGTAVALRDVVRELILAAHVPVEVREDPARMRRADVPVLVGDASALRALGWAPRYTLVRTLRDVFEDARTRRRKAAT